MNKLKLQDIDLKDKKILMRVDFNVPFDKQGKIADDTRIRASLASIQYILDHGGSVILMSHLGRPKKSQEASFSLAPCAQRLSQLLHRPVIMAVDCIGSQVQQQAKALKKGEILLLENVRFHPAEEDPSLDLSFAKQLASLGDIYVNDAFGTAHRRHSSTAIIAEYFPDKSAAGLLMQEEVNALESLLLFPKHPFYAIIGGAKMDSKIGLLYALADKVDALFIGGAMAFPFFKVQGISIGSSLCEEDSIALAESFIKRCVQKKLSLFLPVDLLIANAFADNAEYRLISISQGVPEKWQAMDIGPHTIETWSQAFEKAATLFWNGPVGVTEFPFSSKGTYAIAEALARLSAITIIGGGDSLAAINHIHLSATFTHVSTGGGASLEFIEKGHLPGIDALSPSIPIVK